MLKLGDRYTGIHNTVLSTFVFEVFIMKSKENVIIKSSMHVCMYIFVYERGCL